MTVHRISRRGFLGHMAQAAAVGAVAQTTRSVARINGANDRISIGFVGVGARGRELMRRADELSRDENVQLTAVCDIWQQARERGERMLQVWNGTPPISCRTIGELCERKDIDGLIIATADFQHPVHTCIAVEAGKDVYVEKPLGCDFAQIKKARDAVRRSGRIAQMGTFRRSFGRPRAARDFIQQGRLGRVSYVEMVQPMFQQRWRIPGSEKSLTEADTDWDAFLCYTPKVPFDARKYREFRLFWPYSTGIFCQWMSHAVDEVNLVLDEMPKSVLAGGGVYVWKDGRTNPDTAQCLIEYPRGCLFSYHMRLGNAENGRNTMFYGTTGTLDLYAGMAYGDGGGGDIARDRPDDPASIYNADAATRLPDRAKGGLLLDAPPDEDHMTNFFRCMRSGKKPNADIEAGFAHALATTMAGLSLRTGRRVTYDAQNDTLLLAEQPQTDAATTDCG